MIQLQGSELGIFTACSLMLIPMIATATALLLSSIIGGGLAAIPGGSSQQKLLSFTPKQQPGESDEDFAVRFALQDPRGLLQSSGRGIARLGTSFTNLAQEKVDLPSAFVQTPFSISSPDFGEVGLGHGDLAEADRSLLTRKGRDMLDPFQGLTGFPRTSSPPPSPGPPGEPPGDAPGPGDPTRDPDPSPDPGDDELPPFVTPKLPPDPDPDPGPRTGPSLFSTAPTSGSGQFDFSNPDLSAALEQLGRSPQDVNQFVQALRMARNRGPRGRRL